MELVEGADAVAVVVEDGDELLVLRPPRIVIMVHMILGSGPMYQILSHVARVEKHTAMRESHAILIDSSNHIPWATAYVAL